MTKNFPKLVKQKDTQVQEAQRVPNKMDPKWTTPRYIIIIMAKLKGKKESHKKKKLTCKGAHIRLLSELSTNITGQKGLA